jgi:hypothetical protein
LRLLGDGLAKGGLLVDGALTTGEPGSSDGEARIALPAATHPRGTVRLRANGAALRHAVFTGGGLAPHWVAPAASPGPAAAAADALACPSCWEVADACRADLCGRPCLSVAAAGAMRVEGDKALVRDDPGYRAALACPTGAIDRPRLVPEPDRALRCPRCGRSYPTADDVMDLRSPRARRALG